MGEFTIQVEGLEELQKALEQFPGEWEKFAKVAMGQGLAALVSGVHEDAQKDTGVTAGSVGSEIVRGPGSEIIGKVGSNLPHAPYALEYGRLPGKMPPVDVIEEWAARHGMEGMGFVIARAIGARGVKAPKTMSTVLAKKKDQVVRLFEQGIERVLRSLNL